MNEFINFLFHHWPLTALFIVILVTILFFEVKEKAGGQRIDTNEMTRLMNREKAIVIDIRDDASFAEGHVIGAKHFPSDSFEDRKKKLQKFKNKPMVLVDANGQSASAIATTLSDEGFQAFVLSGGIATWKEENLPLRKGS